VFHGPKRGISGETRETVTWIESATESRKFPAAFIASVTWDAHREIEPQLEPSIVAAYTVTDSIGSGESSNNIRGALE
jgi:hypothetical protein